MLKDKESLLDQIQDPSDLRLLKEEQLPEVCQDLREFIIDVVSTNPGHFGASLGVVELTVALHYAYNTPKDLLVWDSRLLEIWADTRLHLTAQMQF